MTSLSRSDASMQSAPPKPSGGWMVVAGQELRDVWLTRGPMLVLVFSLLLSLLTYLAATNEELNIIDQKDTVNLVVQITLGSGSQPACGLLPEAGSRPSGASPSSGRTHPGSAPSPFFSLSHTAAAP